MIMVATLEQLATRASDGDEAALEAVIRGVQDGVYGLAMRMLGHPEAARDATQEIVIRVLTRLSSFRADSKLTTWVYRIAANYLIDVARKTAREGIDFDTLSCGLGQAPNDIAPAALGEADADLLVEETFIGCTQGMLLCLDRPGRAAFILGAILELDGDEAASILGLSPAAFRKRLSRARAQLRQFMGAHCGLVAADAPCRCAYQVNLNLQRGFVRAESLSLATHPHLEPAREHIRQVRGLIDFVEAYRRHPAYRGPDLASRLNALLGPA